MTETYACSACKETKPRGAFYEYLNKKSSRPVTYECRDCKRKSRSAETFKRALKAHEATCDWCLWPKRLVADGICAECLASEGVHFCERCKTSLPEEHFASPTETICKTCIQAMFEFSLGEVELKPPRPPPTASNFEPPPEARRGERCAWGRKRVTDSSWSQERKLLEHLLRHKYGIGTDEYYQMLAAQDGKCAVCKQAPRGRRRLFVDHDHVTGAVRGLLCGGCNSGLGFFKDSAANLAAAIDYLKKKGPTAGDREPL